MDQPATVAWQYVVRLIFPEDLPMVAAHLLAAGYDSPSLCDRAGLSRRAETAEIDELFDGAMDELGVGTPTTRPLSAASCTTWRHDYAPVPYRRGTQRLESGRGSRR